jgi:hypothetical protein
MSERKKRIGAMCASCIQPPTRTAMQRLFGRAPEYPRHARSFVAHQVTVYKPYMLAMLAQIDNWAPASTDKTHLPAQLTAWPMGRWPWNMPGMH